IGSVLIGEAWIVAGASVGRGMGVSDGSGSAGSGVAAGSRVSVGSGVDVPSGGRVFIKVGSGASPGIAVVDSMGVPTRESVFVPKGGVVSSGDSPGGFLVGRSASTDGGMRKTPASWISAPAFSKVIFTNRALTGG